MRSLSQPICRTLAVLSLAGGILLPTRAIPARNAAAPSVRATSVVLIGGRMRGEGVPVRAFSTAISPDGRLVAAGTNDGRVHLFDARTGKPVRTLATGATVEALAFSPDGRQMAGAAENRVTVWDAASGAKQWEVFGGQGDMGKLLFSTSVSYSPDGRTLAVAAQDDVTAGGTAGGVALLDARTGRLIRTLLGSGEPVNGVAVSPDGKHVAGVTGAFESEHPEVFVWDMATGEAVWNSRADAGPLFSVAYAPDGRTLAVGGRAPDGASVTLWDAASGALVRTFPQGETALSVAYAPDGKTLVSGGLNGTLKMWDPASGALRGSLPGARSPLGVFSVAVAPDGRHIAAASDEGTVKLIEMRK